MNRFRLRNAVASDIGLTYEITREAMRSYVEQTWGTWNEAEQQEKHRVNYLPETHRIVLIEEREVGLLAVEHEPEHLWLVKVYVQSAYQGNGLGSALVRLVVQEATEQQKSVRLRVLRVNAKAKALYERLGFKVVCEEPERYFMVRSYSAA